MFLYSSPNPNPSTPSGFQCCYFDSFCWWHGYLAYCKGVGERFDKQQRHTTKRLARLSRLKTAHKWMPGHHQELAILLAHDDVLKSRN